MNLDNLRDTVSNLTLYDIKAGVRKVQNAVMNYTEMEAKVREATNNEPWGASSTLMQEIANGTFVYQTLNEIMPMIYRRFTEKSAEEWRQIYKALQLLEFLTKHGSERVVDDARSHLTLLKMLRQFHYIDQNGKDQGINVRNRAKELAELLSDVDKIRAERKKARANKVKYVGMEGGSGSNRFGGFGGFGSESTGYGGGGSSGLTYGGYSGGVYGDGGGFGGQMNDSRFRETQPRSEQFEEYDEFDEGAKPATSSMRRNNAERMGVKRTTGASAEPAKNKEPEVDLFSFDEPELAPALSSSTAPARASISTASAAPGNPDPSSLTNATNEDEFDDFQSAAPAGPSQPAAPLALPPVSGSGLAAAPPASASRPSGLSGMAALSSIPSPPSTSAPNYSSFSSSLATATPATPTTNPSSSMGYQPSGPNYYQSVQVLSKPSTPAPALGGGGMSMGVGGSAKPAAAASSANTKAKPAAGHDAFGALWVQASGGKKAATPAHGPAMGQLAKEKSSAGIWGAPAPALSAPSSITPSQASKSPSNTGAPAPAKGGSGLDDLLG